MVASQAGPLPAIGANLIAALRQGLGSLTVTGPSSVLETMYREAYKAVKCRPSQQEREETLSQAWATSSKVSQSLAAGNREAAAQEAGEMYKLLRTVISASRPGQESPLGS